MTTARRKPTKKAAPRAAAAPPAPPAAPPAEPDAIVLTGPPGLVRATVSVENAVDQRVAVRGLTLHRAGRDVVTGAGTALIPPGATADVPVSFRLEPDTPPGDYDAEVDVAGQRRRAVLHVEPDFEVHVSPRRVLAVVGRHAVTLTVTNAGNVPVPVAKLARTHTDDGRPDPGPDITLTFGSAHTLAPGTTTVLKGTLAVPAALDPARRHTARMPVGTADLDVTILPRTASE
jgi:hypothetical protein